LASGEAWAVSLAVLRVICIQKIASSALCLGQRLSLYMRCEVYGCGGFLTVSISDTPVGLLLSLVQQQIFFQEEM